MGILINQFNAKSFQPPLCLSVRCKCQGFLIILDIFILKKSIPYPISHTCTGGYKRGQANTNANKGLLHFHFSFCNRGIKPLDLFLKFNIRNRIHNSPPSGFCVCCWWNSYTPKQDWCQELFCVSENFYWGSHSINAKMGIAKIRTFVKKKMKKILKKFIYRFKATEGDLKGVKAFMRILYSDWLKMLIWAFYELFLKIEFWYRYNRRQWMIDRLEDIRH